MEFIEATLSSIGIGQSIQISGGSYSYEVFKLSQLEPHQRYNIRLNNNQVFYINHSIVHALTLCKSPIVVAQTTMSSMTENRASDQKDRNSIDLFSQQDRYYFDLSKHNEEAVVVFFFLIQIGIFPKFLNSVIGNPLLIPLFEELFKLAHMYNQPLFEVLIITLLEKYDKSLVYDLCKKGEEGLVDFLTICNRYEVKLPSTLVNDILYYLPYTCYIRIIQKGETLSKEQLNKEVEWMQFNKTMWDMEDTTTCIELIKSVQERRCYRHLCVQYNGFNYIILDRLLEHLGYDDTMSRDKIKQMISSKGDNSKVIKYEDGLIYPLSEVSKMYLTPKIFGVTLSDHPITDHVVL